MRRSTLACLLLASATALPALGQERPLPDSAREQIRALEREKESRTPAQRKMGSRLLFALHKQRGDPRLAALPSLRTEAADDAGRVLVDVDLAASDGLKPVVARLRELGAEVLSQSARFRSIRARVPLAQSEELAGMPEVRRLLLARRAIVHKVNTSEGDVAHRAAEARAFFGVDGSGIKICALSDGVDSLAGIQASGDLPAVEVLPGQAGSGNEGTAMLEIIHDLAPGAALGFATAFTSEAQFAQNILDLRAAGCDVIVDDVIYFDESPFQDGPLAQAVNDVTASGALYFSSAGNEGNLDDGTSGTWEGDFRGNGSLPGIPGLAHDFGDGGQSILVLAASLANTLHWADPFGASANDYDLYLMDAGLSTILDASTDVQNGNDDPFEIVSRAHASERLVVVKRSGADRLLNLFAIRGRLNAALVTSGAIRGHSAAADAFAVAAVDARSADGPGGVFAGTETVETFSSDGPRRIFFDGAGNLLPGAPPGNFSSTGGIVRQKPDLAAADGVVTATPGFSRFYGTSASAPHAAAIAALAKQAFPSFTPAQLRAALLGSALDIEAPGLDRDSGAGIAMAQETLADNGAQPVATLSRGAVSPVPITGDGDPYIEPGEGFQLGVILTNLGGLAATSIAATLSTTTVGVTITQPASAYPDLPPAASAANATAFAFSVSASLACGELVRFRLAVSYDGAGATSPGSFDFSVQTGQAGAPLGFAFTGPVTPIPDAPGPAVEVPLAVSGLPGAVRDVSLRIDGETCTTAPGASTVGVDHTWADDLVFELLSPSGTSVRLIDRVGEDGNNFCQTLLDDESTGRSVQALLASSAPFTGSFLPASPLAAFLGEDGNGTWSLRVRDQAPLDTGNVRAFSVIVTPALCESPPTLSIADAGATEGDSGTVNAEFTVSLSRPSAAVVTVQYATASGTATTADYTAKGLTTLTFLPGDTAKTATVAVKGDTKDETDETFLVNLSNPSGALIADAQGIGTILDDDPLPAVSVSDVSVTEGDTSSVSAVFTVRLSAASGRSVSVAFATAPGTATAGTDYTSRSGTLSFSEGTTARTLSVSVKGDLAFEPDETFFLNLSSPVNATLADAQGAGTILNNEPPPAPVVISIGDAAVTEPNSGTTAAVFTVSLSGPTSQTVTVQYQTNPGTATAGSDYTSKALTTLSFAPGETAKTVSVSARGDLNQELDETFFVDLSNPTGGTIGDGRGVGTILNDDGPPAISIADKTVTEGNSGTLTVSFTVTLTATTYNTVSVGYATADGTAAAPDDYLAKTGTLEISPGLKSRTITVSVKGDLLVEGTETFFVNLLNPVGATIADGQAVCTIADNDGP